jgi:hypothetical protein
MGEYADDYFRKEVKDRFGFDPGSMYSESKATQKVQCKVCSKRVKATGLKDHMRDAHGQTMRKEQP